MYTAHSIRLSALAKLPDADRSKRLAEIAGAAIAPRNCQADSLRSRIVDFEARFGMTSEKMVAGLRRGEIADIEEVSSWIMLLRASGVTSR